MINAILILLIVAVFGWALFYIVRAKRRGEKCIGCSSGGSCPKCNCGCDKN